MADDVERAVRDAVGALLGREAPGADDDLLAFGVDSLAALRLAARLEHEQRVSLTIAAVFERRTARSLAKLIEERRALGEGERGIEPLATREGALPVSFEQQAIWFHEQLSPRDETNAHDQDLIRLDLAQPLDRGALDRALAAIVERHEVLRTTYETAGGLPRQRVGPAQGVVIAHRHLRDLPDDVEEVAREVAALRCDLKRGPVMRAQLVTLAEDRHALFVKVHHIAFDGWSANVFARELSLLYEAHVSGRAPSLGPLPLQYADHAAHQRRSEEAGRFAPALAYWRERLASARASSLPTDRPRPKRATYRAAVVRRSFERPLVDALRERARRERATLYAVLLSAVARVVAKASSTDDVVLGMLTAGRADPRVHDLIGCFLNVLPVRVDLSGEPTASELVMRSREAIAGAFAHDVPFDAILRALARPRTEGPLVEVSVVMEVAVEQRTGDAFALGWVQNDHEPATAPPLVFNFIEHRGELMCRIVYKVDLFEAERIELMRAHLGATLAAFGSDGDLAGLP